MEDGGGPFINSDTDQIRPVEDRTEQPVVALSSEKVLIDNRTRPEAQAIGQNRLAGSQ